MLLLSWSFAICSVSFSRKSWHTSSKLVIFFYIFLSWPTFDKFFLSFRPLLFFLLRRL